MKKRLLILFVLCFLGTIQAQDTNFILSKRKKLSVSFELINNLIFIPVTVNGTPLTFLVDSGVEETILFSVEDQEVIFPNAERIRLRGLGGEDSVEAYKSIENEVSVTKHFKDDNHTIFIVLDETINFSALVGIPVNGIIGYRLFKDHVVEIDYYRKKIHFYHTRPRIKRKTSVHQLFIERNKPYLNVEAESEGKKAEGRFLIDTGNSNAFWVFLERTKVLPLPQKNFEDYLGRGFNGDVYGNRGILEKVTIDNRYAFQSVFTAFPDSVSIGNVRLAERRIGSVGGEILKRFTVMMDYRNEKLYLTANKYISDPFRYNKSGIELQHGGLQWVRERVSTDGGRGGYNQPGRDQGILIQLDELRYQFVLKPYFIVAHVRKNSPADKAGLQKGDIVVKINRKRTYQSTLEEMNAILKSDAGKKIDMVVLRNEKEIKMSFFLEDLL